MPALFPRIVNDLQSLRFEFEAQADICLLFIRRDDHETRRYLSQSPPRDANHLCSFERGEVVTGSPILYDSFELVILSLFSREELYGDEFKSAL